MKPFLIIGVETRRYATAEARDQALKKLRRRNPGVEYQTRNPATAAPVPHGIFEAGSEVAGAPPSDPQAAGHQFMEAARG